MDTPKRKRLMKSNKCEQYGSSHNLTKKKKKPKRLQSRCEENFAATSAIIEIIVNSVKIRLNSRSPVYVTQRFRNAGLN